MNNNSNMRINIQLCDLLHQMNEENYIKILTLIKNSIIDVKNKNVVELIKKYYHENSVAFAKNISEDLNYIIDSILSNKWNLSPKEQIEETKRSFLNTNDLAIDEFGSVYLFLVDENLQDPYELANTLNLDGLSYEVVNKT